MDPRKTSIDFLETLLGSYKLEGPDSPSGPKYLFFTPFQIHHKPKLTVSFDDKTGAFRFYCWITKKSGVSLTFFIKLLPQFAKNILILNRAKALDSYLKRAKNNIDAWDQLQESSSAIPVNLQVPDSVKFCRNGDSLHLQHYGHLLRRGVSQEIIDLYGITYSPTYGILFPSHDHQNILRSVVSKKLGDGYRKVPGGDLNHVIWGNSLSPNLPVIGVEGPFDAFAAGPNASPLYGTTIRPAMCRWLVSNSVPYTIFLDGDYPGKLGSVYLAYKLLTYDISVKMVDTPDDSDPSKLGKERCAELIASARDYTWESLLNNIVLT